MKKNFTPSFTHLFLTLIGWLLARFGLVVMAADELARLQAIPEPRPLPPGTKLIPASFIGVDPVMVQRVGGEAAILLEIVKFWLAANAVKGRDDTYNSYPAWAAELKQRTGIEWDKSKVGRLMRSLKEAEILAGNQAAPHKPTTYRKGTALKARDAELHRVDTVVQLPLALPDDPGAKVHDIHAIQTPHADSLTSSSPKPKAAAADAPAKTDAKHRVPTAAAAMIRTPVKDVLDSREASDRRADHQADADGTRHAHRAAPPPVPAAPSPRTEPHPLAAGASPSPQKAGEGGLEPISAAISGVFAEAVARQLVADHGTAKVERALTVARKVGAGNPSGLALWMLEHNDPRLADPYAKYATNTYAPAEREPHPPAAGASPLPQKAGEGDADPARDAWRITLKLLEIQLDRQNFETWVRGAAFVRAEGDRWTVSVTNSLARNFLQHQLYKDIRRVLRDVVGRKVEIEFVIAEARR